MIIRNGCVLHYDQLEQATDLRITEGRITEIGQRLPAQVGEDSIDATDRLVLPGLVDLHTHGLKDTNVQHDSLVRYSKHQLARGVTTCVPTLQGTPEANIEAIRRGLKESRHFKDTPNILGFRPEIGYVAKTGAGSNDSIVPIEEKTTRALWEAAEGAIPVWDVAPELPGAQGFIRWAADNGVILSLAHSSASIDEARRAIDAGLRLVTHFYNTFDVPQEVDAGVFPAGLTDYLLVDDRVTLELVPDGVHVHPLLLEKAYRCKGLDRIVFVTDSVKGAGNPPGIYDGLYKGVQIQVTEDRGMRRTTDDCLSGSALTHIAGLQNAVRRFGKSLREASILCSRTPAELLGLKHKGYLAHGMDADIIVLDNSFALEKTIVGGRVLSTTA